MNRTITLKRKEIIRFGLPQELKDEKVCILGSYGDKNGNTSRALTTEEEDKYMPRIVNLAVTDPGFLAAVTTYYQNLSRKVTPLGIKLEIGEDDNGVPLNLEDWIFYKHAKKHPWTGSKEDVTGVEHLQFYFEDPEAEKEAESAKLEVTLQANIALAKLIEDETKMDWVLRTLTIKYPTIGAISEIVALPSKDKKLSLSKIVTRDPAYFVQVISDKDLAYKAELASMVEAGIITKEGQRYLNGSDSLGSLDGAIAWMKDPNNSENYAILQARLDNFGSALPKQKVVKAEAPKAPVKEQPKQ